jgi:hypothetical protein
MTTTTTTKSESEVALRSIAGHAKRIAAATEARDRAIRAARAQGVSLRTIAEAAGINHQTVQNIIDRARD